MAQKVNTFLILGSGSTAYGGFHIVNNGSNFIPPLDRNFFDSPVIKLLYSKEEFPALHFFQQLKTLSSLEKVWTDIDLYSKLTNDVFGQGQRIMSMQHDYSTLRKPLQEKAQKNHYFRDNLNSQLSWVGEAGCIGPLASWEAMELILKVFGNLEKDNETALIKIITSILIKSNLRGIATFNYDCSIESIWPKVEKKLYYYDPIHSAGFIDGIPLYKLHGSINWSSKFSDKKWSYAIPDQIDAKPVQLKFKQGAFKDGSPDELEEPTVIPPVSFKQNISLDIQNDDKSVIFKKIWNKTWEELENIDILVFIGFSFPETDHHARILFSSANRRKPFKKVIVNTGSDKSQDNYKSIFSKNALVQFPNGIDDLVKRLDELNGLITI